MTKTELIHNLEELPTDIARMAYQVDVAAMKAQIQFDSFLKGKYYKQRSKPTGDKDYDKDFTRYTINGWSVVMETED